LEDEELDGLNIMRAMKVPDGYDTYVFRLSDLDPICKVQEETFFQYVKKSVEDYGLYRPLLVYPIHIDDWKVELETDFHQHPPPMSEDDDKIRLRIQNGCNRFFALKEMGYDAAECVVIYDKTEAEDQSHYARIDKKWQRGSNLEILK
jgi:hypothetical protein